MQCVSPCRSQRSAEEWIAWAQGEAGRNASDPGLVWTAHGGNGSVHGEDAYHYTTLGGQDCSGEQEDEKRLIKPRFTPDPFPPGGKSGVALSGAGWYEIL